MRHTQRHRPDMTFKVVAELVLLLNLIAADFDGLPDMRQLTGVGGARRAASGIRAASG